MLAAGLVIAFANSWKLTLVILACLPLLGLEFHHPFTKFADIHRLFGDDIVYVPYLFSECKDYPDTPAFAADLLRQGTPQTRFWFATAQGWGDTAALRRALVRRGAAAVAEATRAIVLGDPA